MKTTMTLLAPALLAAAAPASSRGDLVALRVGRAETVSQGAIEHAVILIEDGKIVTIGQDLPVDRGIPVVDRPEWTVMPGLVNAYSRSGMDSQGGGGSEPDALASDELYARDETWEELLELGVTTLGLYPAGNGIPGQAVAVRPSGETAEEMILRDHAYLKIILTSNAGSKKALRDGFEKADKFEEKEKGRREKWEKEVEKAKKKKSKKKDGDDKDKDDEEEENEGPGDFVPGEPDADVKPFLQLRSGELAALISIRSAGDYLHLLDAIDDEEFTWGLRVPMRDDLNLFEVTDRIGERELRVVVEPRLTLHPSTRRERNLPRELADAGARLVFVPLGDTRSGHERWRVETGEIVAAGLDRDVALRALTLEPAELLGLGDRLGSLDPGKDANLLFLDGDPLEVATQVKAVMLEGRFVTGEVY
jgi:imidazolonepropionase-like amidohydrolase